jgi:hypothetical protein
MSANFWFGDPSLRRSFWGETQSRTVTRIAKKCAPVISRRDPAAREQFLKAIRHAAGHPRGAHYSNKMHTYEVRPRKDDRRVDLITDGLPFGRLCNE